MRTIRIVIACAVLGAAGSASAQQGARVTGFVYDSVGRRQLVGAEVQMIARGASRQLFVATTDSIGRFNIAGVPAGDYDIGFLHPAVDSLGVTPPIRLLAVDAGTAMNIALAVPSAASIRESLCGRPMPEGGGVFAGTVRDAANGRPLGGARVDVDWLEFAIGGGGTGYVRKGETVTTAPNGQFAFCGMPSGATFFATGRAGDLASGTVRFEMSPAGFAVHSLYVGAYTETRGDSGATLIGDGAITGRVIGENGKPLARAVVQVDGTNGRVTTDATGQFRISGLPLGSRTVHVRAIGYEPDAAVVDVRASGGEPVAFRLTSTATSLEAARITAPRSDVLEKRGFNDRKLSTGGIFYDEKKIEDRHAFEVKNIVEDLPNVIIHNRQPGDPTPSILFLGPMGFPCMPDWYIDGQVYRGTDAEDMAGLLSMDVIVGIEVYRRAAQAPLQYGGTKPDGCGSIVIWTDPSVVRRRKPL